MKILVPIDGSSYSENSLAFLASRASLFGDNPTIELLAVFDSLPGDPISSAARRYCDDKSEEIFVKARGMLAGKKVNLIEMSLAGNPAEQIAKEAVRMGADLIVMGSRGRNALAGLLFGSVTNGVLKETKIPVLILREAPAPRSESIRIGIAVDGSKYGQAAVHYVLDNLAFFGKDSEFFLIHVANDYASAVYPDIFGMTLPTFSPEEISEMQKKEFSEVMTPLLPLFEEAGVKPQAVGLSGNAGDEIAAYAKNEKLGLVVMGSHGYGRLKSAVMGSTAMRIASRGSVPLLVIQVQGDDEENAPESKN